jgi:hypothetical protein
VDKQCDSTGSLDELRRAVALLETALPRFELACQGPDFPSPHARTLFCSEVARLRAELVRLRLASSDLKQRH